MYGLVYERVSVKGREEITKRQYNTTTQNITTTIVCESTGGQKDTIVVLMFLNVVLSSLPSHLRMSCKVNATEFDEETFKRERKRDCIQCC